MDNVLRTLRSVSKDLGMMIDGDSCNQVTNEDNIWVIGCSIKELQDVIEELKNKNGK